MRSLCLGLKAARRGFGGGPCAGREVVGVVGVDGVVTGNGGVNEIVVSILSSFPRPSASCRSFRGLSSRSAWLTLASGPVIASATSRFQPLGWLNADLCIPGAFRSEPTTSASTAITRA